MYREDILDTTVKANLLLWKWILPNHWISDCPPIQPSSRYVSFSYLFVTVKNYCKLLHAPVEFQYVYSPEYNIIMCKLCWHDVGLSN